MEFYHDTLYDHLGYFIRSPSKVIHIIAPFIRLDPLREILKGTDKDARLVVITNWNMKNILQGYSDIDVYPYVRQRGGLLYVNRWLHAKCLIADMQKSVVMTSNVTNKGLGLCSNSNLECAVKINFPPVSFFNWLNIILKRSTFVTDKLYNQVRAFYDANKEREIQDYEKINFDPFQEANSKDLAALPYSPSPEIFLDRLSKVQRPDKMVSLQPDEILEVIHDAQLFGVNISKADAFPKNLLKNAFFKNPYVNEFLNFVGEGKYFGESKKWLQTSCADEPKPKRKHLTRYAQSLFKWVEGLSDGSYKRIRPNHSEYLYRVQA